MTSTRALLRSMILPTIVTAVGASPAIADGDEIGPSFDCRKAQTRIEKKLCEDEFLGFRDGALGRVYAQLRRSLPAAERTRLERDQAGWVKRRNAACERAKDDRLAPCLTERYERRLAVLSKTMTAAGIGPAGRGLRAVGGLYAHRIRKFSGRVLVVEEPGGSVWVEIFTVNGPTAHLCTLQTSAGRRTANTIRWRSAEEKTCQVTLTFQGTRAVKVTGSPTCTRMHCGARGAFTDIVYRRTRP